MRDLGGPHVCLELDHDGARSLLFKLRDEGVNWAYVGARFLKVVEGQC
jgi:hypothetical protein